MNFGFTQSGSYYSRKQAETMLPCPSLRRQDVLTASLSASLSEAARGSPTWKPAGEVSSTVDLLLQVSVKRLYSGVDPTAFLGSLGKSEEAVGQPS